MAERLQGQLLQFLGAGVFASGSHYGIYVSLVAFLDVWPVAATTLGFVVGTMISYTLNARYTFNGSHRPGSLVRFWVVTGLGGVLNAAAVALLSELEVHYALAGIVAIVVAAAFNFTGHKLWTFRPDSSLGVT